MTLIRTVPQDIRSFAVTFGKNGVAQSASFPGSYLYSPHNQGGTPVEATPNDEISWTIPFACRATHFAAFLDPTLGGAGGTYQFNLIRNAASVATFSYVNNSLPPATHPSGAIPGTPSYSAGQRVAVRRADATSPASISLTMVIFFQI